MAQKNAHPPPAQALDLLVETLARHSTLLVGDERGICRPHARVAQSGKRDRYPSSRRPPPRHGYGQSGMLARYHTMPSGDRQYLSLHIAGDLPDLQSLFLAIMDHSLCAIDKAQIASIRHSEILALVKRAPSAGLAFWRHTLIDGAIFRQAITSNGGRSAVARVAHLSAGNLLARGRSDRCRAGLVRFH
jgi:hypothetical protein